MNNHFLRIWILLLFIFAANSESFSGNPIQADVRIPNQNIPYVGKMKLSINVLSWNTLEGKSYIYLKSDNPQMTFGALSVVDSYTGIADRITPSQNGFYELSKVGRNVFNLSGDVEVFYNSDMGTDTTAGVFCTVFPQVRTMDSLGVNSYGNPICYFGNINGNYYETTNRGDINFVKNNTPTFSNHLITSTVKACDIIKYSLTVKPEGYLTFSDYSLSLIIPDGFLYVPNSTRINVMSWESRIGSISVEPSVLDDTLVQLELSNYSIMEYIEMSYNNYFVLELDIIPRPGYVNESINGEVTAVNSLGTIITKEIPPSTIDATSMPYPTIASIPDSLNFVEGDTLFLIGRNTSPHSYIRPSSFTWSKNDTIIFNNPVLRINGMSVLEVGNYVCVFNNGCRSVSSNIMHVAVSKQILIIEPVDTVVITPIDTSVVLPIEPVDTVVITTPIDTLGTSIIDDNGTKEQATTGLFHIDETELLSVYPNPSSGLLFFGDQPKSSSYRLTDLAGSTIQEGSIPSDGMVTIQTVPVGLYFLYYKKENGIEKSTKILKN